MARRVASNLGAGSPKLKKRRIVESEDEEEAVEKRTSPTLRFECILIPP